ESRKRQSKRDEAIRRRIDSELSKKRKEHVASRNSRKQSKGAPGTVLSLRPNDPVISKPFATVYEVAQLMASKRENCILVVDENNHLLGIFTAKDLAFRVVGKGLNAQVITIDQIMTKSPMCASSDTLASDALNLMVQKGFRHLPILDKSNQIVGVLDITKCYNEAMERLEKVYNSSKKLYDALSNVNAEIGLQQQPLQVIQYFESLKQIMNGPTLESVLDDMTTLPVYVNIKSNVYEAALLMVQKRTTAVLVKDLNNNEVSGIFTSKDVVLRVIAAGLDPKTCSVVRVMTPQPDCASKDMTIHQALRQMFEGRYLNLPVIEDNEIIGIVEVLKLTYATLNQIKTIQTPDDYSQENTNMNMNSYDNTNNDNPNQVGGGPVWNKFWTSLDDTDSMHSDSYIDTSYYEPPSLTMPKISQNELDQFNLLSSEVRPEDSISRINSNNNSSANLNKLENKEEETTFSFKFKSPLGRASRITFKPKDGILELRNLINQKIFEKEFTMIGGKKKYAISYLDDENDLISITTDQDLIDCVVINKNSGKEKADIFIHDPNDSEKKLKKQTKQTRSDIHYITGVPNELLLPAALITLAASVLIVFSV
ncbi:CBS-domain-containing protein, partial [Ascoidea rubescens DSM 1968]